MKIKNVRFVIAAITTLSAYSVYVSRINLSIAIIAMVDLDNNATQTASASPPPQPQLTKTASNGIPPTTTTTTTTTSLSSFPSNHSNADRSAKYSIMQSPSLAGDGDGDGDDDGAHYYNGTSSSSSSSSSSSQHGEPMTSVFQTAQKAVREPLIQRMKFDWSTTEQGHILGAFFYGYILFQIPGARFAESVGAKWILLAANAGSAVISLAFPIATQLNSLHLLMMLRCVMGCCQSAFFPAAYVLFCRWLPEKERAILLPVMFIGSNVGSISTYIISSYLLTSSYGWPLVFYMSGLICLAVTLLWCVCGSNGPEDNSLITDEERAYILKHTAVPEFGFGGDDASRSRANSVVVGNKHQQHAVVTTANCCNANATTAVDNLKLSELTLAANHKQIELDDNNNSIERGGGGGGGKQLAVCQMSNADEQIEAPRGEADWSKLIKSVPVWTLILSMYGNEWSTVILCYELPTYLNTALHFPIEQNGVINSFFQLTFAVASPIFSSFGAFLLARNLFGMQKIHVRKLFQSLATFGQLACFMGVPVCGANRGMIILLMFAAVVFKACANAGDIMVAGDLSPEFAGTIFAFANTLGNTAGFCAPLLAGKLIRNPRKRDEWTPFWLFTAAIMCFSGLIFLIFGDTKPQDFAKRRRRRRRTQSTVDSIQVMVASRKHSISH